MIQITETSLGSSVDQKLTEYVRAQGEDQAVLSLLQTWFAIINRSVAIVDNKVYSTGYPEQEDEKLTTLVHELTDLFPDEDQTVLLHQLWLALRNACRERMTTASPIRRVKQPSYL